MIWTCPFKKTLNEQFKQLESLVLKTDSSFKGAVKAQKSKQLKGIERLELRLLKAQKIKLKDHVQRLVHLRENFSWRTIARKGGKL